MVTKSETVDEAPAAADAATMAAVARVAYGPVECLRTERVAVPAPAPGEVLVRVHAAGVDRGAWHLVTGRPYLLRVTGFGLRRPKERVPGREVAGTVAAVGSGVTRFAVGDEVYGIGRGTFAECAVVPEAKLARKPMTVGFTEAAVMPVSATTALQALRDAGRLRDGQSVLVVGASGGVGTFAVQIAKALGATVTGVSGPAKAALVRSLGADAVVDYTREDFTDHRYDLVLDIGGSTPVRRLRRALTRHGTLVVVGGEGGGRWTGGIGRQLRAALRSPFVRQRLTMMLTRERAEDLDVLAALVDTGRVTPVVDRAYPLAQAADALARLESGAVRGKVALTVHADGVAS